MIAQKQFFLHTLIKKQDCKLYAYLVTISFSQTQRVQLLWFRTACASQTALSGTGTSSRTKTSFSSGAGTSSRTKTSFSSRAGTSSRTKASFSSRAGTSSRTETSFPSGAGTPSRTKASFSGTGASSGAGRTSPEAMEIIRKDSKHGISPPPAHRIDNIKYTLGEHYYEYSHRMDRRG